MKMTKRQFLGVAGAGSVAALGVGESAFAQEQTSCADPFAELPNMMTGVAPISREERLDRIKRAQALMAQNKIDAMFLDSGTALEYFTGVRWRPSERMLAAILPADGEPSYVSPAFEDEKLNELVTIGEDVRLWEEHESPYERVAQILDDIDAATGTIAMEERVRFFLFDGIRKEKPNATYVSADPVTIPLRIVKSDDEIRLMQVASDITIAVYAACIPLLEEGMTPLDFTTLTEAAFRQLGTPGGRISCSFGKATAFPHGSSEPQYLKQGDMVLMDGGCSAHGYRSDISRTTVFGEHTERQEEIWNLEKKAQQAGFDAAQIGAPQENVDIAARKVIVDAGFGPGYQVPGLPHRTGHGIGMDGHEWGNNVLGNKRPLEKGMCFSVEPMIAIYGEFGIRLEDCVYMTYEGPQWFTTPSVAIDKPV